jgi:hypothetical protein
MLFYVYLCHLLFYGMYGAVPVRNIMSLLGERPEGGNHILAASLRGWEHAGT